MIGNDFTVYIVEKNQARLLVKYHPSKAEDLVNVPIFISNGQLVVNRGMSFKPIGGEHLNQNVMPTKKNLPCNCGSGLSFGDCHGHEDWLELNQITLG